MKEKIKTANQDENFDFLAMDSTEAATNIIHTETINQYLKAIRAGAKPAGIMGLRAESWFKDYASALLFMAKAGPYQTNQIEKEFVRRLPVSLLESASRDEVDALKRDDQKGLRIQDYIQNGKVYGLKQIDQTNFKFSDDCRDYQLTLIAKGDVDGDGYADLLVSIAAYYRAGAGHSYYYHYIVKHRGAAQTRYTIETVDLMNPHFQQ